MVDWIVSLGAWNWFILAVLLFLLEVLAPGVFMLWLGLSALIVGIFTLDKPIVDGTGAVRIDDTIWRVSGPDCPAGSRVRVAGADGANLRVEAV